MTDFLKLLSDTELYWLVAAAVSISGVAVLYVGLWVLDLIMVPGSMDKRGIK